MKYLAIFIFLTISACKGDTENPKKVESDDHDTILSVMNMQEEAWNNGDIDAFMTGYWKSEELTFIGSSGLQNGWQATIERYHRTYPDRETMGQLKFEIIQLNRLSEDHFQMIGRYTLKRLDDQPTGLFSLLWRKIDDKWLIIADHTC